jgi:hypothetical protein
LDFVCDDGAPTLPALPRPPGLPGIGERLVSVLVSDFAALGDLDLRGIYFTILYFYYYKNIINFLDIDILLYKYI